MDKIERNNIFSMVPESNILEWEKEFNPQQPVEEGFHSGGPGFITAD